MGLFDLFKKNKAELTEEQKKWNKMWEMWGEGKADSPYSELMKYQSEVNNGGHDQYFFNIENTGDLQKEMSVLETILPEEFRLNLRKAYSAYLAFCENDSDESAEETLENCDSAFYENEEPIDRILKEYAEKIVL